MGVYTNTVIKVQETATAGSPVPVIVDVTMLAGAIHVAIAIQQDSKYLSVSPSDPQLAPIGKTITFSSSFIMPQANALITVQVYCEFLPGEYMLVDVATAAVYLKGLGPVFSEVAVVSFSKL